MGRVQGGVAVAWVLPRLRKVSVSLPLLLNFIIRTFIINFNEIHFKIKVKYFVNDPFIHINFYNSVPYFIVSALRRTAGGGAY